jgi:hypothetical protein
MDTFGDACVWNAVTKLHAQKCTPAYERLPMHACRCTPANAHLLTHPSQCMSMQLTDSHIWQCLAPPQHVTCKGIRGLSYALKPQYWSTCIYADRLLMGCD